MDQKDSIALWLKGKDAWNEWANGMLAERKVLEGAGEWEVGENDQDHTEAAENWLANAYVDFNGVIFGTNSITWIGGNHPMPKHSFINFVLPDEVSFNNATFQRSIFFARAQFKGTAQFSKVTFEKLADFQSVKFKSRVIFRNSIFKQRAVFSATQFEGNTDFSSVVFENTVNFSEKILPDKTVFTGRVDFNLVHFKMPAFFNYAEFKSTANFASITSDKSFNLLQTNFTLVPDFTEAAFHAPPVLDEIEISKPLKKHPCNWNKDHKDPRQMCVSSKYNWPIANDPTDYRKYRALGKMAADSNDYQNAMEAFANEIRCRRFWKDQPMPNFINWFNRNTDPVTNARAKLNPTVGRFWIGLFYGVFSNFGRGFFQPVLGWLSSTVIFAGLYALTSHGKISDWFDPVYISIRHGLIFSGLTRSEHWDSAITALYATTKGDKSTIDISNTAASLMLAQPIISAVFIFLFLLAVRNQFKIR